MHSFLRQVPICVLAPFAVAAFVLVDCQKSPEEVELPWNPRLSEVFKATLGSRAIDLGVYEMALTCPTAKGAIQARVIGANDSDQTVTSEMPCSEAGTLVTVRYGLRDGFVVRARYDYDKDLVLTTFSQVLDKRFGTLALVPALSEQVSREHMVTLSASRISAVEFTCEPLTQRYQYAAFYAGSNHIGRTSVRCKEHAVEKGHASVRLVNDRIAVARPINPETTHLMNSARMPLSSRPRLVEYADTYKVLTTKDIGAEEALALVDEFVLALGPRKNF